jgi:hypothetical protein
LGKIVLFYSQQIEEVVMKKSDVFLKVLVAVLLLVGAIGCVRSASIIVGVALGAGYSGSDIYADPIFGLTELGAAFFGAMFFFVALSIARDVDDYRDRRSRVPQGKTPGNSPNGSKRWRVLVPKVWAPRKFIVDNKGGTTVESLTNSELEETGRRLGAKYI